MQLLHVRLEHVNGSVELNQFEVDDPNLCTRNDFAGTVNYLALRRLPNVDAFVIEQGVDSVVGLVQVIRPAACFDRGGAQIKRPMKPLAEGVDPKELANVLLVGGIEDSARGHVLGDGIRCCINGLEDLDTDTEVGEVGLLEDVMITCEVECVI